MESLMFVCAIMLITICFFIIIDINNNVMIIKKIMLNMEKQLSEKNKEFKVE